MSDQAPAAPMERLPWALIKDVLDVIVQSEGGYCELPTFVVEWMAESLRNFPASQRQGAPSLLYTAQVLGDLLYTERDVAREVPNG